MLTNKEILSGIDRAYKNGFADGYEQGREEAINEFLTEIMKLEHFKYYTENNVMDKLYFEKDIKQIAEQLKENKS